MDEVRDADAFCVGVTEGHMGIVAADSAHFGGFRFGRADDFADERDGFDAFEDHSNNRTGRHIGEIVLESLFAAASNHCADVFVVGAVMVFVGHNHFHTDDF